MGRYLMILAALVWIGSTIAFLMYVPVFSVLSVALIVMGLGVMFAMGVEVGRTIPAQPAPEEQPEKRISRREPREPLGRTIADFFSRVADRY